VAELPPQQSERVPLAMRRAEEKLARLPPDPAASRLLNTARRAASATQRVMWLQRAASAWAKPMQEVAACRKGCDHCCHIPLTISKVEAELIGKATGRSPQTPITAVRLADLDNDGAAWQRAQAELQAAAPDTPCPFLVDHACSIYESRPLPCRILINLDDDELLCRKVDGVDVPVPYADAIVLKAHYMALQPAGVLADIRHFFPAEVAP
jgi:uncharacterized protein